MLDYFQHLVAGLGLLFQDNFHVDVDETDGALQLDLLLFLDFPGSED